ncbi:MAG: hypothetical protein MUE54_14050 [Anaerolineae bacterium]|nr:hypothetical protein [Anaerolineae bacterium]
MDKADWEAMQARKQNDVSMGKIREVLSDISSRLQPQYPNLNFKIHAFDEGVSLIVRQSSGADVAKIIYEDNQYTFTIAGQPRKRVTLDQAEKLLEETLAKLS